MASITAKLYAFSILSYFAPECKRKTGRFCGTVEAGANHESAKPDINKEGRREAVRPCGGPAQRRTVRVATAWRKAASCSTKSMAGAEAPISFSICIRV